MYTEVITVAVALFASTGLAAPVQRAESEQFDLSVTSVTSGSTLEYDHAPVTACHSGAAIEALCVYGSGAQTFTFNSTTETPIIAGQTSPGYLVYTLPSQPTPDPQQLEFQKNETSNVNAGFFGSGSGGPVKLAFSANKALGVVVGDTLQYTWYVCPQTTLGYQYDTVSYVAAGQEPSDPDCRRVSVERS